MVELLHCVAPALHDRTVARGFEAKGFAGAAATHRTGDVLQRAATPQPVGGDPAKRDAAIW